MGLAERRIATDFQTNHYPALEKKIHDAAGFAVPLEVRWDTLAGGESRYSQAWIESWPKVYFLPIIEAFSLITRDAMGKQALEAALKKIVVHENDSVVSSYWASFDATTGVSRSITSSRTRTRSRTVPISWSRSSRSRSDYLIAGS